MTGPSPTAALADSLQKRSDREIAMLRATYRVMARDGSNRLTLQAIADEAATSKGLVSYHFKSKSALLQHTMEWALLQTERRIRATLAQSAGSDVLADTLDAIFISPKQNRDFQLVYLDLIEAAARDATFAALPGMVRNIVEGLYQEIVRTGVEAGQFATDDPARVAREMRVIIDGVLMMWLQGDDWEHTHTEMKQLCLDMLRRQFRTPSH